MSPKQLHSSIGPKETKYEIPASLRISLNPSTPLPILPFPPSIGTLVTVSLKIEVLTGVGDALQVAFIFQFNLFFPAQSAGSWQRSFGGILLDQG